MNQQLDLSLDADADQPPLPARLGFPMPTDGGRPFDDDARFFEPWWPGAHAFLKRVGDHFELRTEHLSDPFLAFPELLEGVRSLKADGLIVEGTLLALDADGRPDASLLRRCLTGATDPDAVAEGAFVAADLPYLEGLPLARQPFVERRRKLASVLPDSDHCVLGRGVAGEGRMLAKAVASMGLGSISARRLDGHWRSGDTGDTWLRLRMKEAPTVPTRPFLVLMERLPLRA